MSMLQINFVLVLVALISIHAVFGQMDYCTPTLCPSNVAHVACRNDSDFGPACDETAIQLDLLETGLQKLILDAHNARRSQVALGNLTGFPSASKMQEMTWDDELAYVAGFNVRKCAMRHDLCHATSAYPSPGQNVAWTAGSVRDQTDVEIIAYMVNHVWFGQWEKCPTEYVHAFASDLKGFQRFATMVQQKNGKVGCAVTQFRVDGWFNTLMTCNYEHENADGEELYAEGEPCSECVGECSVDNPGLCV